MTSVVSRETLQSISIPDSLNTPIGTLQFADGAPQDDTVQKIYDHLDYVHGVNAFLNAYAGASTTAIRQGSLSIGAPDNSILLFSELMDSQSLFLTANADTVYFLGFVDLSDGPMVVETPPGALGIFDDMWWQWIVDFGLSGPDRGEGGRYLLVGPDYDGDLPDSGFHVGHSRTRRVLLLGRAFLENDDPKPTANRIKATLKIYPYVAGGAGTSIATLLSGDAHPGTPAPRPNTTFVEASGLAFNTIPPAGFGFYELLHELVQEEPADATGAEVLGELEAIGIVKGKPFNPDVRMRRILDEAAKVGNATSRVLMFDPRASEEFEYYPGSSWTNMLFVGGYDFETPPAQVTVEGIKPLPPTGSRKLHSRTAFFYIATGITPAMCMRLTNVGSQYVMAFADAKKQLLDGGKAYRLTLPPDIPEARFWSITLYDNETRSMLQTPQRFPRAGSQAYPTPSAQAERDGSTVVLFGPERPDGVTDGNWIQTTPGKGYFAILRLYSPTEAFFDKSWRPSEIEPVEWPTTT